MAESTIELKATRRGSVVPYLRAILQSPLEGDLDILALHEP